MSALPQGALPRLRLIYQATVDVGERESLGDYPDGSHHIVPILGGEFEGPGLRGRVLPGGADRQRWRPAGVRELDAHYEMLTEDGSCLRIHNQVLVEDLGGGQRYARSVLRIAAPDGPLAWMNRRWFVGTLDSLRPARAAVRVGVYLVE